ncbi:hypothetical protein RND81_04G240600 [Saponaria officinalis]|uniref:Homeobox domain-containing protein n=1 Tax=Saponaria officinalis TaxID=3572 RepID=A0AAW1LQN5_SAPOF
MEDSSELQLQLYEENKSLSEKNKGRQYKSKEQLQGLEDFYTEHKYPTEALKAEMAIKLNLTEKQVSGWFCHRRLKDKRLAKQLEQQAPGRQDLSSGIIQDRASGLKQDSCSSTKQADNKRVDPREVESQRYSHENLPVAELNFQQRSLGDGTEMDDTSSESNSALQESFYPQNKSHLAAETSEFRASNGFVQHSRGRVGPSGYLKIKGQTENAAITAVKRQLGRHYREDGPSLGIEFDPLPPGAFEPPSNNIDDDSYGVAEPISLGPRDVSGFHKRPGLSTIRDEEMYEARGDMHMDNSNPEKFSFRQPKQRPPFPNHTHGFPEHNSSFGSDSYSGYHSHKNPSIPHKHDLPGMRPNSYGGNISNNHDDTSLPDYDDVHPHPQTVHRREQFSSRPAGSGIRHKDPIYKDDRMPFNRAKAKKRGREEFQDEAYPIRSSQDLAIRSKQPKGPKEMPSSFSEDETAETSSSMD